MALWPRVASALLSGGLRCEQILGTTTRWSEETCARPMQYLDLFATPYQRLGSDVAATQFTDLPGRPQTLIGDHCTVRELIR